MRVNILGICASLVTLALCPISSSARTLCSDIKEIVIDAPSGFSGLRGPDPLRAAGSDVYPALRKLPAARSCEIEQYIAKDWPPEFRCEWSLIDQKSAEAKFEELAGDLEACGAVANEKPGPEPFKELWWEMKWRFVMGDASLELVTSGLIDNSPFRVSLSISTSRDSANRNPEQ